MTSATNTRTNAQEGAGGTEEVHFYPGSHEMIYLVNGQPKLHAEAWGGPPHTRPRAKGEKMAAEPTEAGEFVIAGFEAYRTDTWALSKIPWGTPIRRSKTHAGEVEYQLPSGTWRPLVIWISEEVPVPDDPTRTITVRVRMTATHVVSGYAHLYHRNDKAFPDKWVFNDFGPVAVRYYRDRNKNRKRDAGERLEGRMIHTTPKNEADSSLPNTYPSLVESHGCVHIRPADLKEFRDKGAFRPGMPLVIHRYNEMFDWSPYRNY